MKLLELISGSGRRPRDQEYLVCECLGDGCIVRNDTSFCLTNIKGYCMTYLEKIDGEESWQMGCLDPGLRGLQQCKGPGSKGLKAMACCSDKNFCNIELGQTVQEQLAKLEYEPSGSGSQQMYQTASFVILGCFVFVLAFLLCIWIYRKMRNYFRPNLAIWQECKIGDRLDAGRFNYSSVWKARYNKMDVVVKIYHSQMQHRFRREIECYDTTNMRNQNLLGFVADDIKDNNGSLEYWFISYFHLMGSLHDYLRMNPIRDIPQLLSIFYSIIEGLDHLHSISRGSGKVSPGIAHRDLKSRSILMRSSHKCCIADFGMSVISDDEGVGIRDSINLELTNPRYMAPEVLNGEIFNSFNDYTKADIYSLGLIFWEVLNCLQVDGHANPHQLPYEDLVPEVEGSAPEDMMEPMRQVVCGETYQRPPFTVTNISKVIQIQRLIRECFAQKPSSRLGSLLIKERVFKLQQ